MNEISFEILEKELLDFEVSNSVVKVTPELENIEITPSKEEQTFKSKDCYGYDNVKVNPVTNEIDSNIKPENIKEGIEILGVQGILEDGYKVKIEDDVLVFEKGGLVEEGELII